MADAAVLKTAGGKPSSGFNSRARYVAARHRRRRFEGLLPSAQMSRDIAAEGWYRDPYGLHEDRWFSDGRPTKLVRDGGVEASDEPPSDPPGELVALPAPELTRPPTFAERTTPRPPQGSMSPR
jgi:hypothetical protein